MSETSKEWAEVDYSDISNVSVSHNSANRNITLTFMLSPMDVPVAWREYSEKGQAVIEFKYLSADEHWVEKTVNHISFRLGKNSKRIYRIQVDIPSLIASGESSGKLSIRFAVEAKSATSTLDDKGMVKKSNAKAIISMLEPVAARAAG